MCLAYTLQSPAETSRNRLLVDTAGEEASIDNQCLPGDERRAVRSEKDCGADQLLCLAEAPIGVRMSNSWPRGVLSSNWAFQLGSEYSGSNGIDCNAFL